MTKISILGVQKLAKLSALTLDPSELESMQKDLSQILEYVEQLQGVDTEGIEPTYQAHSLETITRPDEVIEYEVSQKDLLKNAPKTLDGTLIVPRVLQ